MDAQNDIADVPEKAKAPNPRDEFPDILERKRRLADLIAAPALPLIDVAVFLGLPVSTLDKLRAQGKGPHVFRLGRRLYARQTDLRDWLDKMSVDEAA